MPRRIVLSLAVAIAALLLGADRAVACDIDEKCMDVAYENAALNGIGRDRYTVRAGDVLSDAALARELAFSLRPLDQLMAGAQEGSQGPVADFFQACRQAFAAGGRESWADSWAAALEATNLPLTPEDRRLLREAGDVLGRYDGESQRAALEALLARLEDQGAQAQAEAHRLFRVYLALGVAAGLFCLILL